MKEIHEVDCGPHMNGRMLAKKILRQGHGERLYRVCKEVSQVSNPCESHAHASFYSLEYDFFLNRRGPFLLG